MKRLNYKNFKKVHEDAHSATLQHPEGHQIKIAKGPLSDHIKKQLGALPFANGGEVSARSGKKLDPTGNVIDEINPVENETYAKERPTPKVEAKPVADESTMQALKHAFGYADGGEVDHPMSLPPEAQSQQDVTSQLASMPGLQQPQEVASQGPVNQPIPQAAPQAPMNPDMMRNFPQEAMQQAQAGIVGQAQTESNLGKQEAQAIQKNRVNEAQINAMHQEKQQQLISEIDAVVKDVKDQKIDPNHFWNERSTLGKASTAIGLILGGMGSGLTGGPNPALQFLNQQIDRDIEGQRMQMGQKMNMLSALQHQLGNNQDATNMAKAMQAGVYASQMLEAAAKSKDPMAMARAQQANAQILSQYGPMVQQTAMRQSILQGMKQGGIEPEKAVPYLVPEPHQKEVYSEIKKAQDVNQLEKPILENFDKAAKENTILKTGFGKLRTPVSIQTLEAMALPMIHDQEGRVNEYEMKTLQELMPQPGDTDAKIAGKRQGWINFMHQKQATPTANSFGIQVPKSNVGKFNPR